MLIYFGILIAVTLLSYVLYTNKKAITIRVKVGIHNVLLVGKKRKGGCLTAFLILAFFSAVREGVGVDYDSYLRHIELIQEGTRAHYMEVGFKQLVILLKQVSSSPRLVIILIGILTTWLFISAIWEQSCNPTMSVFLFIAWGYYFLTYNTIRNYFALAIIIYAIQYIKNSKMLYFFIFVAIASLFHKSALVCIPIYLLANSKWKKSTYFFLGIGTICALLFSGLLRFIVFKFYPGYEGGAYDTGRISYLNVIKAFLVIAIYVIFYKSRDENEKNRLYFHLNVLSLAFYVGMYWVPEISRIGFYMNTTSIFLIPNVIGQIEKRQDRKILKYSIYLFSLIIFFLLCRGFYAETVHLLPYQTWLF